MHIKNLLRALGGLSIAAITLLGMSSALAAAPVEDYSLEAGSTSSSNAAVTDTAVAQAKHETSNAVPAPAPAASDASPQQRLQRLEQQVNYLNKNDVGEHLSDIQQKLQKLSGDLEEQQHKVEQLQKQLNDFYADLDQRIKSGAANKQTNVGTSVVNASKKGRTPLNAAASAAAATPLPVPNKLGMPTAKLKAKAHQLEAKSNDETVASKPRVQDTQADEDIAVVKNVDNNADSKSISKQEATLKEQQSYQDAFNDLQNRSFDNAAKKFRIYVNTYPNSTNVGNAHYWLGEIYFMKNSYAKASSEFDGFVKKYPHSPKVPTARFKLAYIHAQEGKRTQAEQEYTYIKKHFPNSAAAKLAEDQLSGNAR